MVLSVVEAVLCEITYSYTVGGAGHSSDQVEAEVDPSLFPSAHLCTFTLFLGELITYWDLSVVHCLRIVEYFVQFLIKTRLQDFYILFIFKNGE